MISFFKLSAVVLSLAFLSAETTFAKVQAKPVTAKAPVTKKVPGKTGKVKVIKALIFSKEFKKLSKESKFAYIEALRTAAQKMQAKDPSFAEYMWGNFVSDAEAVGVPRNPNIDLDESFRRAEAAKTAAAEAAAKKAAEELARKQTVVDGTNASGVETTRSLQPLTVTPSQQQAIDNNLNSTFGNLSQKKSLTTTEALSVGQNGGIVYDAPTLKCDSNDATRCYAEDANPFQLRCFYGGWAIGKASSGQNSCSPVVGGDLCDPQARTGRDTRPKIENFSLALCKMNSNAGKCDGGTGTISARAAKSMIVCNPLLYGLNTGEPGPGGTGVGSQNLDAAHVICVPKSANASKACEAASGESAEFFIEKLIEADGGAEFDNMILTMQNTCGKAAKWESSQQAFVDNGNVDALRAEVPDVRNVQDLQDTCITLMNRAASLRNISPGNVQFQKAAEDLGVR